MYVYSGPFCVSKRGFDERRENYPPSFRISFSSFYSFSLTELNSFFFSISIERSVLAAREEKSERVESSKITRKTERRGAMFKEKEKIDASAGRGGENAYESAVIARYHELFNATAGVFTSVERTSRVNKIMQLLLFCTTY